MSSVASEALLIILLILVNGVFSMSELAIVSARKVRLEQWAKEGNAKARAALRLIASPTNFLSTVQIGITLIGILSGALGGATVAQTLQQSFDAVPLLQPYSKTLSFAIVVGIITYLSLVVGELVPKRLAMSNAEQIACAVAPPMRFLANIGTPVVYLLSISTEALLSLLGIQVTEESQVTEEEIKVMIAQGAESGMFEEAEHDMVERVFRLGDRPIKSLMTPRTEIDWLDVDAPFEETQREVLNSGHSRFPVARENLDDCVGIVEIKAFLNASLNGTPIDLVKVSSPPLYVAETASALSVLEQFKQSGDRVAMVTDEYGGVEGIVTLTDLLEAIVGDLPSNDRQGDPDAMQREDGSWLIDGMISSDRLKEILEVEELPYEKEHNYHTLGGLMMTYLRHIPMVGEHFTWERMRFEVVDMDGNRVDKVLVNLSPPIVPPDEEPRSNSKRT
ncbi:MAG: hemolysin family protein [Pseudanabaena sp.]|jgi:putative hemolysin|nr:HlyC/CorC family transporter [Pseudanabaena sp. M090S1SP2A07QC]MCA6505161.1 HlyC/CorC family transporter [Pseudanabaena sp. M172S2SP2A07QC]MCA6509445.1 HlyC/CorC family transporter [Pseudanabaena sp. M109S1SP2A07QC]MCA6517660.1 HlyC/CorC family transporter [Pseudanabaena sp. M110S1SP2A07QC]MCA6521130.1 HlyC/CorC family transporter [Pseudanabaena sp. M051S1SP2A07QC]MCA6526756.1 HlyC/CorC family transporter [Pseudanabaena sp. M179S2SP2A07QC]MCA6530023.1 HlyC/CorC family transporter [Pseudana